MMGWSLSVGLVSGGVLLALGLFLTGPYWSLVLWALCQQAVLAFSYNFLGGMGREFHLGHCAFFGLGAYVSAVCLDAALPWWIAMVGAGSCGALTARGLAAFLVGFRGPDFALSSLCVAILAGILARNLGSVTGGVSGLSTVVLDRGVPYLSTLALLLGTVWIHHTLMASRWGRALRAVGSDPLAASQLGIPGDSIRAEALVLGSALASLAGGIYPMHSGYVSPESAFGLDVLLAPVVAVLLGGPGTRWGPLWGSSLLVLVQEFLLTKFQESNLLLFGLFLVVSGLRAHTEVARHWAGLWAYLRAAKRSPCLRP